MSDLRQAIERVLSARQGSSAREILAEVRRCVGSTTKTDVNQLLYSDKTRFWNDGGTPPRWSLIGRSAGRGSAVDVVPTAARPSVAAGRADPQRRRVLPALYAWQEEALEAWRACERRAVVEAVTGTGKTLVGVAAAIESIDAGGQVLVLVPTVELQRQWVAQFRALLPGVNVGQLGDGRRDEFGVYRIIVAVVNSARHLDPGQPTTTSLLLADECHRYGSASNAQALKEKYVRRLGLSATYGRSDDGNEAFLDPYFGGTCFRMDYRRAIADDVTARFRVALVGVNFAPGERERYEDADTRASNARRWLVSNGWAPAEPFGEFMKVTNQLAQGDNGPATMRARSYLKYFHERRRVLAESRAKTARLRDLVPALGAADRSILFTQTVDASEEAARVVAAQGLAAKAIHSGLGSPERRTVLTAFAAGDLHVITAPQVLDEGIDVPAADLAVILAASRTRRQMIQRMGRVLRRKPDGRLARFAILYVEGSSEDPAHGAHGDFLDEVTEVADEVRAFDAGASGAEICRYLEDVRPKRPVVSSSFSSKRAALAQTSDNPAAGPTGGRTARSAPTPPPVAGMAVAKPPKSERDRLEAAALGITVAQLLDRRRAEAAENLRLSEEAKRLGISVKELRRRSARGR